MNLRPAQARLIAAVASHGQLQVAAGVWKSSAWVLLALVFSMLGVYFLAIRHEEIYLERKFGDAYRNYKAAVPRWLGFGRRVP